MPTAALLVLHVNAWIIGPRHPAAALHEMRAAVPKSCAGEVEQLLPDDGGIDVSAFLGGAGSDLMAAWEDGEDGDEETELLETASMQHDVLSPRTTKLPVSVDPMRSLRSEGVARVASVLSEPTSLRLRDFILGEIERSRAEVEEQGVPERHRFSQVLSASAAVSEPPSRFDLRLPLAPVVADAVAELLCGASELGDIFDEVAGGPDGELWELGAVVSLPGAAPQVGARTCIHTRTHTHACMHAVDMHACMSTWELGAVVRGAAGVHASACNV